MKPGSAHDTKKGRSAQRRAVLRTAWIVGGIAIAVYLAFLLSGMLAQ
jgi:hypothetical protein